jgi:hypothetical protein
MARRKAGIGQGYSGKVGGIVQVQSNGLEIIRMVQVRSKKSWSEKQLLHRERFKKINEYCGKYTGSLIPLIWNPAAEFGHGYNLFLKANSPAFSQEGELAFADKLHFSAGKIPLPPLFTAKRAEGDSSKVEVKWTDEDYFAGIYTYDELMMVAGFPDHFTKPIATGVIRKKGEALIDLPEDYSTITGIWLFFRAHKKDGYSGDQYFAI